MVNNKKKKKSKKSKNAVPAPAATVVAAEPVRPAAAAGSGWSFLASLPVAPAAAAAPAPNNVAAEPVRPPAAAAASGSAGGTGCTCGGGTSSSSGGKNAWSIFQSIPVIPQPFPHSMYEKALRKYAHPAAVEDFELLTRNGTGRKLFLEDFGETCFDLTLGMHQLAIAHGEEVVSHFDCPTFCPLVLAQARWKGTEGFQYFNMPRLHEHLIEIVSQYGRELPPKSLVLLGYRESLIRMRKRGEMDMSQRIPGHIRRTYSNSVRKEAENVRDWTALSKLNIEDLMLYDPHMGQYVEGKLIVEPATTKVGTGTILEDENGDVVQVTVYNMLPDGIYGSDALPLASIKLPVGATVRIVEPFFKIYQDGSRGIRVDDSNKIIVVSSAGNGHSNSSSMFEDEDQLLISAKDSGNSLVHKKNYIAASEAYISGIRRADLVPTLLSNRSQAYAMMNDWPRSLADAAASLTMRPDNDKTWARYHKAQAILIVQTNNNSRDILTSVLKLEVDQQAPELVTMGRDAAALKDAGNAAFGEKDYGRAAAFYTSALVTHGETSRALLSNWALCCLRNCANLDALSASLASLRIRREAKAINRLAQSLLKIGDLELYMTLTMSDLAVIVKGGDVNVVNEWNEIFDSVTFMLAQGNFNARNMNIPKHLPTWIGPIELFYGKANRGHGIKATADIQAGDIVLIEPPLATAEMCSKKEVVLAFDTNSVEERTQVDLRQAIIRRSQQEYVLSFIVEGLADGINQHEMLTLRDLVPHLASCACKNLLPTHNDYMKELSKVELTADQVDAVVDVNSFGSERDRLAPASSLFNKSMNPVCAWTWKGECIVCFALRDIKDGEELTIYSEEAIQNDWGGYDIDVTDRVFGK